MILRRKLQLGETNAQFEASIGNLPENNDHIANYILEHNGDLPPHPLFEKHPYLDTYQLQNVEKYIIGTFPPISYIYDHPLLANNNIGQNNIPQIPTFHGNMSSMWKYFFNEEEFGILSDLIIEGLRYDARVYIYERLVELGVNYSDIIKNTRRQKYSTNDDNLFNINPNLDLIIQILKNPKVKYLNFNTSTLFNISKKLLIENNHGLLFAGNIKHDSNSLSLFLLTLQKLGFHLELSCLDNQWHTINQQNAILINNTFRAKVLAKLRISISFLNIGNFEYKNLFREFTIILTPSPSDGANIALVNSPIYTNWLQNQPNNLITPTILFRKYIYQLFRNSDWGALQAMNVNF